MHGKEGRQAEMGAERPKPRRLSEVFAQMVKDNSGPVSLRVIRDALGDRGFAGLLVFFAALNMIPLPPPASAILGLPMILVSAQMIYGSERAWLPRFLMERSITAPQFAKVMNWAIPKLESLERVIRPRYWPFWKTQDDRIIGIVTLLLGIIVTLPIPLGNWLPACAIALFGVALSERDGFLLVAGTVVATAAIGVILAFGSAALFITHYLFGWF